MGAEPDVLSAEAAPAFKWGEPDVEGLVDFLVVEKNFNEDRVRTALKKLHGTKGKSSQGVCAFAASRSLPSASPKQCSLLCSAVLSCTVQDLQRVKCQCWLPTSSC